MKINIPLQLIVQLWVTQVPYTNKKLLAAIINVKNTEGNFIPLKALLDSGSQNNIMTKECIDLLYLKGRNINASVSGINGTILNIKKNAVTTIANASKSFNHT